MTTRAPHRMHPILEADFGVSLLVGLHFCFPSHSVTVSTPWQGQGLYLSTCRFLWMLLGDIQAC